MKAFCFAIVVGGVCVAATALDAAPIFAADGPMPGALVQQAAYGDPPMPHRRGGGGGRRRGASKKSVEPTLPAMNGATREDADKEYKKKYGF